jgi:hypothetical protein
VALNLWKIGGQPTSYNPMATNFTTYGVPLNIGDYKLTIKAKSSNSSTIKVYTNNNSFTQKTVISPNSATYEFSFTNLITQNFFIQDFDGKGIIIDSIELVQKPLPKLTLNGLDGFLSGKWTIDNKFTVIDDETLYFDGSTLSASSYATFDFDTIIGQTYVLSFAIPTPNINNMWDVRSLPLDTSYGNTATGQTSFSFTATSVRARVRARVNIGAVSYYFKRPMLNLGSIPAPYSRKTGDKMMLPIAKKNLFNMTSAKNGGFASATGVYSSTYVTAICSEDYYEINTSKDYFVSRDGSLDALQVYYYDLNKTYLTREYSFNSGFKLGNGSNNGASGTVGGLKPSNAKYIRLMCGNDSTKIQFEEGTVATSYEPYTLQANKRPKKATVKARTGLAFNGTSDYFQLPSMTMDSVEIECLIDSVQTISSAVLFHGGGKLIRIDGVFSGIDAIFVNGITQSGAIVRGNRSKIKVNFTDTPRINSIFSTTSALSFLKGTLYKVTCYLGNQIVAQYDFENPSNIVGTSVLQKAVNLVPNFEDTRWSLHPSTQVLGKDVLRLNAAQSFLISYITLDVVPNKTYTVNCFHSGEFTIRSGNSYNGSTIYGASIDYSIPISDKGTFTVPNDVNQITLRLANRSLTGTFDFIRPQLYALSGNEGTLNGTPTPSNKPNKRILYNKR